MAALTIAELPFHERPVLELLHFEADRLEVDDHYAGFGWAKVDRLWLDDGEPRELRDALVLALHSADAGAPLADDIELEFELAPGGSESVLVLASAFLERWLPKLPAASEIVLAMCNPHHAVFRPRALATPVHYAIGDVESWLDEAEDLDPRIILTAPTWCTLRP